MFNVKVDDVTFNRDRLLNDAKNLAISSSVNFFPKREVSIENFSANKIIGQLKELLDVNSKYLSNYDKFIADRFIEIFLHNNDKKTLKEQDLFDVEKSLFFELIRNPMAEEEKIEHMLKHNKKLDT